MNGWAWKGLEISNRTHRTALAALSNPHAVLVIGAHREELAFGERVAQGLPENLLPDRYRIRTIPLVSRGHAINAAGGAPTGRPLIPPSVWAGDEPLYVALELYLREQGAGGPADWRLARYLVRCIADCVSSRESDR